MYRTFQGFPCKPEHSCSPNSHCEFGFPVVLIGVSIMWELGTFNAWKWMSRYDQHDNSSSLTLGQPNILFIKDKINLTGWLQPLFRYLYIVTDNNLAWTIWFEQLQPVYGDKKLEATGLTTLTINSESIFHFHTFRSLMQKSESALSMLSSAWVSIVT